MEYIGVGIFFLAWFMLGIICIVNPRSAIKSVSTMWRLFGVDPNNPSREILILVRVFASITIALPVGVIIFIVTR